MSKQQLDDTSLSRANHPFALLIPSYHMNAVSATSDVFCDFVSMEVVHNRLNLIRGLTDTLPDDSVYTSLNTVHGGFETGLEDAFQEERMTLSSFFASQLVDVPRPFQKTKSLFTVTARLPKQKLINLLMRHGFRLRTLKAYSLALSKLSFSFSHSISQDTQVRS